MFALIYTVFVYDCRLNVYQMNTLSLYTMMVHIDWMYTIWVYNRMYTIIIHFTHTWRMYTERVYIKRILYEYTIKRRRAGGGVNARIYKTMNKEWWWLMIECKTVTSWLQGDEM